MVKLCSSLLVAAIVLFGAHAAVVCAKDLTYDGSTTIGDNILREAVKVFEEKTSVKFSRIGGAGSGRGFKAVMEGKVDIAGVSKVLNAEEKNLKPYYRIIGYDAISVFVNEKNPIRNLSKEQLKGIFQGKIKNWKEVGGNDALIVPVTEFMNGQRATLEAFHHMAMDGAEFGPTLEIDLPHDCVRKVVEDVNAITYASASFKEPGAREILLNNVGPSSSNVRSGAYLLSRPLNLVAKNLPKGDIKKFFDFMLSAEGQEIVGKKFVPIK